MSTPTTPREQGTTPAVWHHGGQVHGERYLWRSNRVRCLQCGRLWDGNAQCICSPLAPVTPQRTDRTPLSPMAARALRVSNLTEHLNLSSPVLSVRGRENLRRNAARIGGIPDGEVYRPTSNGASKRPKTNAPNASNNNGLYGWPGFRTPSRRHRHRSTSISRTSPGHRSRSRRVRSSRRRSQSSRRSPGSRGSQTSRSPANPPPRPPSASGARSPISATQPF